MYFYSKNGNKKSFSYETKASISLILTRRMCLWHPSRKERRLFYKSMFVQIDRRTLILKMVRGDVFLKKPKRQSHLSQRGECVYDA